MDTPLSSLPTDNLYKFLALSGLALLMFSFWLRDERTDAARFAVTEEQNECRVEETETEAMKGRLNIWDTQAAIMEKERERLAPTNSLIDIQDERAKRLTDERIALRNEMANGLEALNLKVAGLHNKVDLAGFAIDKADQAEKEFYLLAPTGGFCCIFGIVMWYRRVQVIQDRILANEATNHPKRK
jgi:hypothetical protein